MGHSTKEDHKNNRLNTSHKCSGDGVCGGWWWWYHNDLYGKYLMCTPGPKQIFPLAKTDLFSSVDTVSKPCQSLTYKTIRCKILQFKAQCKTLQFKAVMLIRTSSCIADGFISQQTHTCTHTHKHAHTRTHMHKHTQPALKQNYRGCTITSCLKQGPHQNYTDSPSTTCDNTSSG